VTSSTHKITNRPISERTSDRVGGRLCDVGLTYQGNHPMFSDSMSIKALRLAHNVHEKAAVASMPPPMNGIKRPSESKSIVSNERV
jgi:hypothetical protein